jgi:hypothetical protein
MAVGLQGSEVCVYPLTEAYARQHPLRREIYQLARVLAR